MRKTALTAEASYQFGNAFVGVARRVTFFPQQCVCLGVFKVAFQLFRAINIYQSTVLHVFHGYDPQSLRYKTGIKLT